MTENNTMLANFWNRIAATPLASVLFVLALAVIAAQLSTMVMVVQAQVDRAHLRAGLQSITNNALGVCTQPAKGINGAGCETSVAVVSSR